MGNLLKGTPQGDSYAHKSLGTPGTLMGGGQPKKVVSLSLTSLS